jgi:hypothetical protein
VPAAAGRLRDGLGGADARPGVPEHGQRGGLQPGKERPAGVVVAHGDALLADDPAGIDAVIHDVQRYSGRRAVDEGPQMRCLAAVMREIAEMKVEGMPARERQPFRRELYLE